ncbi:D-hexose-6-phosphate mutarotase [Leucothrix arctica]|uniref:Putative glucose-6-phosphate 1-epimerase n=1 Tax=Leucothrix arctica TaxID=1481894 RepID=A0A317C5L2_9GAMM|nr:D-hexose-6-phosphate mutarotase [Leucothrix arctica]PWQ93916.1 D-hexose-6-phosphate mutarotase [Leucothrix arctica]
MLSLPSSISYQQQPGMLKTLMIDNQFATAEIALFGAHMLSFIPKHVQRERLYVSDSSIRDGKRAIRGGVPICWPWFGGLNEGYQMHGYARERVWELISATEKDDCTELVLSLADTIGEGFFGKATVSVAICVGKTLSMSLTTTNVGDDAFEFSTALHTYFAVDDINRVELVGMTGDYTDKVNDWAIGTTPVPYRFPERTDRIHFNPAKYLTIVEGDNTVNIESAGHDSIIVWNPGAELSKSMTDMSDDSYLKMLCVETGVTQGKKLAVGEIHTMSLIVD